MRPDVLERREGRVWRGGALPGSGLLRKAGDKVICRVSGGRWGCSQGHQEIKGRMAAQQGSWAVLESIHTTLPMQRPATSRRSGRGRSWHMAWPG